MAGSHLVWLRDHSGRAWKAPLRFANAIEVTSRVSAVAVAMSFSYFAGIVGVDKKAHKLSTPASCTSVAVLLVAFVLVIVMFFTVLSLAT